MEQVKYVVLKQCSHVVFPFPHQLVIEVLPNIMEKTKQKYVLPSFTSCVTYNIFWSYEYVLSWAWHFCHGCQFNQHLWESTHVIVGIFEVHNTVGVAMVNQVKVLLDSFGLFDKIIVYVKDRRSNLNILNLVLTCIVTCFFLQLTNPFVGPCFGHAMSKAC